MTTVKIEELAGKNIVVFDLEIKNPIDGTNVKWTTPEKMGISVGCLFDFKTMDFMVYLDDNLDALVERIIHADLVSGFNINGFDIPLLRATTMKYIAPKTFDLLDESRAAVGYKPGDRYPTGLKLDDHLAGTFGKEHMKTDHGSNAPILFQEKKMGQLISYCLADVKRERDLFSHVWNGNQVTTKTHGQRSLRLPQLLLEKTI